MKMKRKMKNKNKKKNKKGYKMNKKLILSLSTVALLSSSLFANMPQKMEMQKDGMQQQSCMKKMKRHSFGHKKVDMIITKIMMLDLTSKQKDEIKKIINEFKDNLQDPSDAFSDTGFDKDMFIEAHNHNFKTMIENRANLIEKVYAVLTKEQKKDLKTILDMDKLIKKKFDKMMGKAHKPEFRG
eukprot:Anaeramoba_flamelloidesa333531_47.p2 GENE.a333531_47~~a333531_47.p2  ORF type:complete len:184 (+),score=31.62 a333531_47:124-675(+)